MAEKEQAAAAPTIAKLTKAQRARLIPLTVYEMVVGLNDDVLLAVHDLTHQEMLRRAEASNPAPLVVTL